MELDFSWIVCLIALLLAALQLMVGFALGTLLERRRLSNQQAEGLMYRRSRQLVQWVCNVLDDKHSELTVPLESMERIYDRLEKIDRLPAAEVTQLMIDVVNEVVRSNEHLRDQIAGLRIQIQQQGSEIESKQTQAMTDALTGLPNRRALDLALTRRFSEWKVQRIPLAVALIDIDRFKLLNDTHGHLAGDGVLKAVASRLRNMFRSSDVVARFGGEEFAIVLPNCGSAAAEMAIAAAIEEIDRTTIELGTCRLVVTVSAGLVVASDQCSLSELLRQADEALYYSKEAGRNCAHIFVNGGCQQLISSSEARPHFSSLDEASEMQTDMTELRAVLRERLVEVNGGAD
jgi:diguanylate cyclase (GGDEF)-like protein